MTKKNTVTSEHVERILEASEWDIQTKFGKTTIVTCVLPNGFIIVESSSCVDPANYDEAMGNSICVDRIRNKVWELEGYKLQSELEANKPVMPNDFTLEAISGLSFGEAIEALKAGNKLARAGWNGKNMFVYYVPANSYAAQTDVAQKAFGPMVEYNPYLAIRTVTGAVSTWVPSVNDVLANDWEILV